MSTEQAVVAFDVCGPLPAPGVTVLEASAGTGKTFTIAALAARYVAGGIPLHQLLIVTFTRMATGELRDRFAPLLTPGVQLALYDFDPTTLGPDDPLGQAEYLARRSGRLLETHQGPGYRRRLYRIEGMPTPLSGPAPSAGPTPCGWPTPPSTTRWPRSSPPLPPEPPRPGCTAAWPCGCGRRWSGANAWPAS